MSSKTNVASVNIKNNLQYNQCPDNIVESSYKENIVKRFKQRIVYNSSYRPRDIENQMVRPLQYSFMLCRNVLQKKGNRSYADVVKQAVLENSKKGISHFAGVGEVAENQHIAQKVSNRVEMGYGQNACPNINKVKQLKQSQVSPNETTAKTVQ